MPINNTERQRCRYSTIDGIAAFLHGRNRSIRCDWLYCGHCAVRTCGGLTMEAKEDDTRSNDERLHGPGF